MGPIHGTGELAGAGDPAAGLFRALGNGWPRAARVTSARGEEASPSSQENRTRFSPGASRNPPCGVTGPRTRPLGS